MPGDISARCVYWSASVGSVLMDFTDGTVGTGGRFVSVPPAWVPKQQNHSASSGGTANIANAESSSISSSLLISCTGCPFSRIRKKEPAKTERKGNLVPKGLETLQRIRRSLP